MESNATSTAAALGWSIPDIIETAIIVQSSSHSFHAMFTLLLWDYLTTLDLEVARIWSIKGWRNANKVLFVMNRYGTILQYTAQLLVLNVPWLAEATCKHAYRFPYASALYSIVIAELILILRTYALYALSKPILILLISLWLGHLTVMIFATWSSTMWPLPPGFVGCALTGPRLTMVLFWATPWIADTVIFALTFSKVIWYRRRCGGRNALINTLLRDGFLYYAVIVGIDTINIGIFLWTSPSVRPIGGEYCAFLTTVMISHLQLNLMPPSRPSKNTSPPGTPNDRITSNNTFSINSPIAKPTNDKSLQLTTFHSEVSLGLNGKDLEEDPEIVLDDEMAQEGGLGWFDRKVGELGGFVDVEGHACSGEGRHGGWEEDHDGEVDGEDERERRGDGELGSWEGIELR